MFHHTHGKDWYRQSDVPGDPRRQGTGQSQDNISVRVCWSIGASLARKWNCTCSIGKNDRGGISTGGVLLGCNV